MSAPAPVAAGPVVTNVKPRVLMVLSSAAPQMADGSISGYYWSEAYHAFEVFTKAGYEVDVVSETGATRVDDHSVKKTEQLMMMEVAAVTAYMQSSHPLHKAIEAIRRPEQIRTEDYAIVYFAGGHACLWDLPTAEKVQSLAAQIYERGGVVSAVCHGPAVFGGLKLSNGEYLVKGKKINGFTVEEEQAMGVFDFFVKNNIRLIPDLVKQAGGIWMQGAPMKDYVISDSRVVTGQNPASSTSVAQRAVDVAHGKVF